MKAYLEPTEISLMEKAADNLRDRLLVRVLFHSGCRISEALALTVDDIDLKASTITILHLKTRMVLSCPHCGKRLNKSHIYCPGCGSNVQEIVKSEKEHRRVRSLPIDETTLAMLKEYINRDGPVARNGKKILFNVNRHRGWQIIRNLAGKVGLPELINPETGRVHHVSPHKLRDAFSVLAVKVDDSGDGLRLLQQHLGHQSFNTTARYRKVSGEEQRNWYEKLWPKDKA